MSEFNKLGSLINDSCNLISKSKSLLVFFWPHLAYLSCAYITLCVTNLINTFVCCFNVADPKNPIIFYVIIYQCKINRQGNVCLFHVCIYL